MSEWSIDLCRGWERIAMVEAGTFVGVERWLEPGEWSLEMAAAGATDWQPTGATLNGRPVLYGPQDVDTVRLVRNRQVAFAGFVAPVTEGVGGFESTDGGRRWRWTGPDLWHPLNSRLAFPDPATSEPWGDDYDERTGVASTVLAGYLRDNVGVDALAARVWPGFEAVDQAAGLSGDWSARLQTLTALTQRICRDGGIGCWLSLDWDGTISATLGAVRNLSEWIVVSDQADLSNVHLFRQPAEVTWTLAGGQGTGTSRTFRSSSSGSTGAARVEVFSDQTSLATTDELDASAAANTALGAATWAVQAEVTDALAQQLRYGRDFRVGDSLAIEVEGVRYTVPVSAVTFDIGPARQVVRPTLGAATPDALRGLIRDVANLAARFDRDIA